MAVLITRVTMFSLFLITQLYGEKAAAQTCGITNIRVVQDTISCGASIDVEIDLAIPATAVEGDTYVMNHPVQFQSFQRPDFQVKDSFGDVIAQAVWNAGWTTLTFTLTDYVENHQNIFAEITVKAYVKENYRQLFDQNFNLTFTTSCGQSFMDTLEVLACNPYNSTAPNKGSAWTDGGQGTVDPDHALRWLIRLPEGPYNDAYVVDTGGAGYDFDCGSIQIRSTTQTNNIGVPVGWSAANPANYTLTNCSTGGFEIHIQNAAAGEFYRIDIRSDLTDGATQNQYTNTVNVDVDGQQWTRSSTRNRTEWVAYGDPYNFQFVKTANTSTYHQVGDVIDYSFTITNNDGEILQNVVVNDPLLGGTIACSPTTIAPGATLVCGPVFYTVTQADIANGEILNTATFSAETAGGNSLLDDSGHRSFVPNPCEVTDVRIVPDTISCGGYIDLEIDLVIPNSATEGDTFSVDISPTSQGSFRTGSFQVLAPNGQIIADVDIINSKKTAHFTLTDYVDNNTNIFATVALDMYMSEALKQLYDQTLVFTYTDSCGNTYSDSLYITACNPWNTNYTAKNGNWTSTDQGLTNPNQAIRWWFHFPEGPYTSATLTDTAGPGFDFDCSTLVVMINSYTSNIGQPMGWVPANPANYNINYCNANGFEVEILNADEGETYYVTIRSDLTDGGTQSQYVNTAYFDIDGDQRTRTKTLTRTSGSGGGGAYDLDFVKTADVITYVQVGDIIQYSFTVTNNGDKTLSNIEITDPLLGASVINCTPDPLGPGQSASCGPVPYAVTQADLDNGEIINNATFNAEDGAGNAFTATAQHTVTAVQDPEISLVKTGVYVDTNNDGITNPGDEIEYVFTVTNTGNVTVSGLSLDDPLLNLTGQAFVPDELASGDSATYTAFYTITQADIDNGEVVNQAVANGEDPNGDPVSDISGMTAGNDAPTVTPLVQVPDMALVKTGVFNDANSDGFAQPGETVSYTFSVTNIGNVTLSNITVDDPLTGTSNVLITPASLAPGQTGTATASYSITQQDIDAAEVVNTATTAGEDPNGDPVTDVSGTATDNDTPTVTPLPQNPDIALVKTGTFDDNDGDGFAQPGETVSYTFSVTNIGNVTLSNITVDDPLTGTSNVLITPASLAPGQTGTATASYSITQHDIDAGEVVNTATTTGTDTNGDPVADTSGTGNHNDIPTVTPLPQNPGMILVKTATFNDENGDGLAQPGETVTYTFTATNTGNVTLDVSVNDVPIGLNNIAISPAVLAPGDSGTATYDYPVTQSDIDNGEIINQASATGVYTGGNTAALSGTTANDNNPTITPLPQNPSINLVKTGLFNDDNGNGFSEVGETITYTFTITNDGNTTVNNLTIDDLVIGVVGLSVSPATLAPGAAVSVTYDYPITQTDIDYGEVINQASAMGLSPDGQAVYDYLSSNSPDTSYNDEPTVTSLPPPSRPEITLIKAGLFNDENGDGYAETGETISYSFTVRNTGNTPLENIDISDALPGIQMTGGPISLLPGEEDSSTFSATYTITEADVLVEQVTNQALATALAPPDMEVEGLSNVVVTGLVRDCRLTFYNAISSAQDGRNKRLYIENIECYPNNTLDVFNRWGNKVFYTRGYDNETRVFTGFSQGVGTNINQGKMLPAGTYYYVLKYESREGGSKEASGYLYIK